MRASRFFQKFFVVVIVLILVVGGVLLFLKKRQAGGPSLPPVIGPAQPPPSAIAPPPPPEGVEATSPLLFSAGFKPLFAETYLYPYFSSTSILVFDPKEGLLKRIHSADQSVEEIYRNPNLTGVTWAPGGLKAVIQLQTQQQVRRDIRFHVLDLQKDTLTPLPSATKEVAWLKDGKTLLMHVNNLGALNYLATFDGLQERRVKDLALQDIKMQALDRDHALLFEKPSAGVESFLLKVNIKTKEVTPIFDEQPGLTALAREDGKLIFVSYLAGSRWVSALIDSQGAVVKRFAWSTLAEKCSFETALVCGVPLRLTAQDLDDWYRLKTFFSDQVVIVARTSNQERFAEFQLPKEAESPPVFDIVKPWLNNNDLFFFDRKNAKIFRVPLAL